MILPLSLASVMYVSPWKSGAVMIVFVLWCLAVQWADRDAVKVKTFRETWATITVLTGSAGLFAWLMIPWREWALFLLGWGTWVVFAGGGLLLYVGHRNKRVNPLLRVLTPQHLTRLMTRNDKDTVDRSKHEYRVRLYNHAGKSVELPNDVEEAAQFSATQELLYDAMWRRATEIEVSAFGDNSKVIYVIDGIQAERSDFLTAVQAVQVVNFVKKMANLSLEEKRRPQRGTIRVASLGAKDPSPIDVLASGSTAGERIRLKIITTESLRELLDLGIHPLRLDPLQKIITARSGVLICSGPPQSGVTSTLYAILRKHDAYIQNIHTLEKQRLLELDIITQNVFNPEEHDMTYSRKLQSLLRREPDVMMVGEMDDKESARLVAAAGAEGKKIYAGMTAKDSFTALETYLMWVTDRNLTTSLLGITNQRLIRKLCPTCREAYKPDPELLKKANLPVDKIEHFYRPPSQKIFDKKGREIVCPTCQGTGYIGQTGLLELLTIDDALRTMLKNGAHMSQIKGQARKNKMLYLQEEGLLKTIEGATSMNEVIRSMREEKKAHRG